jgi:phage shock protein A
MNRVKRFAASIVGSFDWMISQVENHEALIDSALNEVNHAGAKAKAQLARVNQDGKNMRKKLVELHDARDQWRERAQKLGKDNDKRALECVKRLKRTEREIAQLEEQEREHAKIEKQLQQDLAAIEERLVTLRRQRNIMRTRQSRAEALRTIRDNDSQLISEIDDIFERWEVKVNEYELLGSCASNSSDELEEEFLAKEEEEELRHSLEELLNESVQKGA